MGTEFLPDFLPNEADSTSSYLSALAQPCGCCFSRNLSGRVAMQEAGFQEVKDAYRGSFSQVLSETRRRPTFCFHLEEHLVLGSNGPALSTPSLPCAALGNRSQPTATVLACLSRFGAGPICDRLPPVATTGLHKGTIFRCLNWRRCRLERAELWSDGRSPVGYHRWRPSAT